MIKQENRVSMQGARSKGPWPGVVVLCQIGPITAAI